MTTSHLKSAGGRVAVTLMIVRVSPVGGGCSASHTTITKTVRQADYLSSIGVEGLAVVYSACRSLAPLTYGLVRGQKHTQYHLEQAYSTYSARMSYCSIWLSCSHAM